MKTALVIMAAGIGSRFGGGIKQLAAVGPNGEIIMDYSIHDAIEAGFDKIVFIIRHDIEEAFKEAIGDRIEATCKALGVETAYAFQALEDVPAGFSVPEGRTKPWGTGQAVLACKGILQEPFAVINADDYYGKEAFVQLHDFLQGYDPAQPGKLCMAGFVLKNTLSDNGAVTRGICQMNAEHYLTGVLETSGIEKTADGAAAGGKAIDVESLVSMNMWGLTPAFVDLLESGFVEFFEKSAPANPLKAEYLLPIYIDELLQAGKVSVKVLPTHDKWFGVTYAEDKQIVIDSFCQAGGRRCLPQGPVQRPEKISMPSLPCRAFPAGDFSLTSARQHATIKKRVLLKSTAFAPGKVVPPMKRCTLLLSLCLLLCACTPAPRGIRPAGRDGGRPDRRNRRDCHRGECRGQYHPARRAGTPGPGGCWTMTTSGWSAGFPSGTNLSPATSPPAGTASGACCATTAARCCPAPSTGRWRFVPTARRAIPPGF